MATDSDLAVRLASALRLEPHPEGGRYRQVYRSGTVVEDSGRLVRRPALTAILFLLSRGEVSRWHRVLSDEVWFFHEGDPLEVLVVDAELAGVERHVLGRASEGLEPIAVVPAGAWQAARPLGDLALVSCTVGPGFDFADFVLLADLAPEAARLRAGFPGLAELL
ncbi:MAG: cupin domain-containing protein [Holophagales bacterium]|nr:cupin domain-containing protein [Holophagales bacterium]